MSIKNKQVRSSPITERQLSNATQSAAELATRNRQGNKEHIGYGKDYTEGKLREFKAHVQCCNSRQRVNVKKCTADFGTEKIEQNKNGDTEKRKVCGNRCKGWT
jgi:hypothetical protein